MSPHTVLHDRDVDIGFCIDGTGSMSPCIEAVKENAARFRRALISAVEEKGGRVGVLRVKVIVFRDFKADGSKALQESLFYPLPLREDEFSAFMQSVYASGGGDAPENGLEALVCAMRAPFCVGRYARQIIVLFSDADTHPLLLRKSYFSYPEDMPDDAGLCGLWSGTSKGSAVRLRPNGKRLILFAPSGTRYEELSRRLDHCVFRAVQGETGLREIDFGDILDVVAASVCGE